MFRGRFQLLTIAVLAGGMTLSSRGADFAVPAEGPVAFRRDKVPLDTDTLADLSQQLTKLAEGLKPTKAEERRGAAQMLALATALNPGNTRARNLIEDYRRNRRRPAADLKKLEKDRTQIWQYIAWLETREAGQDGQALAACLKDVIAISDPKDPRAEALQATGQLGAWAGWIPPLASYEEPVEVGPDPDETEKGAPAAPVVALKEATVSTMIWQAETPVTATPNWKRAQAQLVMAASVVTPPTDEAVPPFSLLIGTPDTTAAFAQLTATVMAVLKTEHPTLPDGIRVTVECPAAAAGKDQDVSAAIAVLANSALTGREPDATILGTVDDTGAYKLNEGFWDQLRVLETAKGSRLILPAAAADYLPAMLAFEKPQFFLKHEVLLAKDFKQLVELSAKAPSDAAAVPFTQFAEIKARATPQSLGTYLTNTFVRRRLADIVQTAPYHYSARMLAIQGSGNRPTSIPRLVMVAEIRRALKPVVPMTKGVGIRDDETSGIGRVYESCRTSLDGLVRYAQKDDRALLDQALDLATSVRGLDRASRARSSLYDTVSPFERAYADFLRIYSESVAALAAAAGEPLTTPPP